MKTSFLMLLVLALYSFSSIAQSSFFEATLLNNSVKLKWQTSRTAATNYFEIERSWDMTNFKTIGLALDGITGTEGDKYYAYKDNIAELPAEPIIYYRLKEIKLGGKINYSSIIVIRTKSQVNTVPAITK